MIRYLTASIPYVNATPHIGHALEFVQVDALLRYYKAQNNTVRAQFGSDDNSLKNVRAAQAAGENIEDYVARHSAGFRGLLDVLNIADKNFIRTRDDIHMRGAQKLWSLIADAGDLYRKSYEGLYCVGCEAFYAPEDLLDGNLCPTHKKPVETVHEENWFFKLSKYQDELITRIQTGKLKVTPDNRKNEMLAFIKRGLEDFSVSRSVERAENWGVPVPNDPSQVMYVWVDALSNYITALGFADDSSEYETFWKEADTRTHIIGKDIARFHVIYWIAFLLSAKLPLPTEIFVHGFLTNDGQKMSKSLGNVLAPADLVKKYGVDATRYMLLKALPLADDGDISYALMDQWYEKLANSLGNLVGRVAAMSAKYFPDLVVEKDQSPFADVAQLNEILDARDFKKYLESVDAWIDQTNTKVQTEEPFKTIKTDPLACQKTLAELAAMIIAIARALAPIMPNISAEILKRYTGYKIIHGEPLFPKQEKVESGE